MTGEEMMRPPVWNFHCTPVSLGAPIASYTPVCARLPRNIGAAGVGAAVANHKRAIRAENKRSGPLEDYFPSDLEPAPVYPREDSVGFIVAVGVEVSIGKRSTHL